jgi:hypothetical protein
VETVESYNTLAQLGCDYAQGYFLSKPLSPEKMSIWLEVFCGMEAGATAAAQAPQQEQPGFGLSEDVRDEPELEQWSLKAPEPVEPVELGSGDEPDGTPEPDAA